MRLGLIADVHVDSYLEYATQEPWEWGSLSSRAGRVLDALRWASEVCGSADVDHLVVLGDLFHQKTVVDTLLLIALREVLARDYYWMTGRVTVVVGNHDAPCATHCGLVSLLDIERDSQVWEPKRLPSGLMCAPWWTRADDLKPARYLLGHLELQGAKTGPGEYVSGHGWSRNQFAAQGYRKILLGHYHARQQVWEEPETWYIGSLLHHSFNEEGTTPGLCILDTESGELEWVENTRSPRFVTLQAASAGEIGKSAAGNYVRLQCPADADQIALKRALVEQGAAGALVRPQRGKREYQARLASVGEGASDRQIVEEFVAKAGPTDMDRERLVRSAVSIMGEEEDETKTKEG